MPYVAPEVVQRVKQIDLLTYLKNYEPYELVHFSGNTYTTRSHDSLKISNGKWMWWSRGIGGRSALDYLIKVRGYDFMQAVDHSGTGGDPAACFHTSRKENREKADPSKALPLSDVRCFLPAEPWD